MARYREFKFRGDDVLGSIASFASPNDDLAKLFAGHKGPIVRFRTHNQNMTVAARAIADRNTLGHRS